MPPTASRRQLKEFIVSATTIQRETNPVPDGEFVFTWADFRQIAAMVHGEAGIVLAESKANLVYSRLAKRLRAIGLRSFREYCELIAGEEGVGERQSMIAAMTTNVTRFFREQHHFDHLAQSVLPRLAAAARRGQRVRIWSSACSSGEEPYSIALTLLNAMPDAPKHDVLILASDIDPDILDMAAEGSYALSKLEHIPPAMRGNLVVTDRAAQRFHFADPVRGLIRFRNLNLLRDWPIRGSLDVIFCRNVMIYFDQETQDAIWARFAERMTPEGTLYIGHSERIATDRLPFVLTAQTTYRSDGKRT